MADFKVAYNRTMGAEGGYSNNPNDAGGETWKGVARKKNPSWAGWPIVDQIKKNAGFPGTLKDDSILEGQVQKFYKEFFWDCFRGDNIANQSIANEMFDTGVNCGPGIAVQILQRSLNILNKKQALWPNITIDGGFGAQTMDTINRCLSANMGKRLYSLMNILQGYRYIEIMERNESQEEFAGGWLSRCELVSS